MSEILYLVSCLHDRKKVEVIRHFFFGHECIANLRTCILNIDQLEMNKRKSPADQQCSLWKQSETTEECCVFYFRFHDTLSKESHKIQAIS